MHHNPIVQAKEATSPSRRLLVVKDYLACYSASHVVASETPKTTASGSGSIGAKARASFPIEYCNEQQMPLLQSPSIGPVVAETNTLTRKNTSVIPRVCLPIRNNTSKEIKQLECSAYVTIEPDCEAYVTIHDILKVVSEKTGIEPALLKWKHFNDKQILLTFSDKLQRDTFVDCNRTILFGDTYVKFKSWPDRENEAKSHYKYKIWLKILRLPIKHYCYNSVEFIVSGFGRLHKCNLEKTQKFLGNFQVMVDVHDLDVIKTKMEILHKEDKIRPIYIEKVYYCDLHHYNATGFDEAHVFFVDIMYILAEQKKLNCF